MLYSDKARTTRFLTILVYLALIAVLTVTTFYPNPVEEVSVMLILSVKLIPLLAFMVPVFRGSNRGYIWLSFVVIFYFTQAVVSAWLSEGETVPLILTFLSGALFVLAMVHLKANRPTTAN
ncbi:MAG: DUF2069 domain-containing protein [Marinobacter sp.]|uniref:DUF2069 domain-containing protein n=1 Tax=Marinobacter sp. TaxID=50741 RepID=UPI00299D13CC|nr:DUF2069 domain-containing protein [Marinobacter sp.]MDX1635957.1 DUF2069 domain-containing protein [Marinobacter sp.]